MEQECVIQGDRASRLRLSTILRCGPLSVGNVVNERVCNYSRKEPGPSQECTLMGTLY